MYQSGVTVVHVINSKLYINFLVRVKYEWLKLDDFTMVFLPRKERLGIDAFLSEEGNLKYRVAIRIRKIEIFSSPVKKNIYIYFESWLISPS